MKKYTFLLLMALVSTFAFGQLDRSVRPEPGSARNPEIAEYKEYTLDNGLRVFVVENDKLPRVSMSLIINKEPVLEGDKAGMLQIAGDLLSKGTINTTKDDLNEKIDFMGARLSTSSSSIFASSLANYTEEMMEIMAEVAMMPNMTQEEFDKIKTQLLSGLETQKDEPNSMASNVMGAMLYGKDHPYGEVLTVETVNNITLDDCKKYYADYFKPNHAYLAIVGDISPRKAKKYAKKYFGDWAMGDIPTPVYQTPAKPANTQVAFVNRDANVQSVVRIGNAIDLKPGADDIAALSVMNQILGGGSMARLFKNLREDKAYTYGSYSSYSSDPLVGSFMATAEVRNEVTDSAITQILYEFDRIRTEKVSAEELRAAKNYLAGSFGRSLESPQTVSRFALNIARYKLPKDYYNNYLSRLEAVTIEDVMAAANKYIDMDHLIITVVGKASEVAAPLKQFGDFQYYDYKADKADEPSLPLPEGVTAESIVMDYLAAIGGVEKINKIKSISKTGQMNAPGAPAPLVFMEVIKSPKYIMEVTMEMGGNKMSIQKEVFDGKTGKISGMQQNGDMDAAKIAEVTEKVNNPISEMAYLNPESGYKIVAKNAKNMEGKLAYVLEVTDPNGEVTTEYYSADTHLKLAQESTQDGGENGPMVISMKYIEYKEFDGIKFPTQMVQSVSGQSIPMQINSVEVNGKVNNSVFK